MSQHHHHDNKHHHHHPDTPKSGGWKPARHNWGFYAAGVLIMIALVLYLLSADLRLRPVAPPAAPATSNGN